MNLSRIKSVRALHCLSALYESKATAAGLNQSWGAKWAVSRRA